MSTVPLEHAIQTARSTIAHVTPDHLSLPTPCASWTVADLIDHMIGAQGFFASAVDGTPGPDGTASTAGTDLLAAFDSASGRTLAAFSAEGAMERMVSVPFGTFPAAVFIGFAVNDTFTHAWDLAKALGLDTDLAPDLAAALLESSKTAIPESFRGADGAAPFGHEQPVPADATNADRLAAFLGRTV